MFEAANNQNLLVDNRETHLNDFVLSSRVSNEPCRNLLNPIVHHQYPPTSEFRPTISGPNLHGMQVIPDSVNHFYPSNSYQYRPSNIHKWNLMFDGSKDGLDVERFLYRVESNASSYNIPECQLLNDIQYLLKGKALNWFWAHKEAKRSASWNEFHFAMLRQFKDDHSDFDVRQALGARKQKPNETFQDFYASISEIALALSASLSDLDFMLFLQGNMRPGLKEKLAGKRFSSSADLFDECVRIENTWRQISFVPDNQISFNTSNISNHSIHSRISNKPNPNFRQVHEVEFENRNASNTYPPTKNNITPESLDNVHNDCSYVPDVAALVEQSSQTYHNPNKFIPVVSPRQLFEKVKCWNCGLFGHCYVRCQKPLLHVFCCGCGQSDITFDYCIKCRGNSKREARPGHQPSQNLMAAPNSRSEVEETATNTDPEFYRLLTRNSHPK